MSTPLRLALYAAVLAGVFAVAALAGAALEPGEPAAEEAGHASEMPAHASEEPAQASEEAHGSAPAAASSSPPGLAVAQDGLRLDVERTLLPAASERERLAFRILDARGEPVRAFDVEHDKRMHLIVVRRDLTGFQHLHPEMGADGTWRAEADLSRGGTYRVYADFVTGGAKRVLSADVHAGGRFAPAGLPEPATTARTAAGHEVTLATAAEPRAGGPAELTFTIRRDGERVEPEPYLGARGHLVALRAGDLAYLHTHPEADTTVFETTYPSRGAYRLYLQFKDAGRVHTAALTQEVTR